MFNLNVNIVKSSIAGILYASYEKFYKETSNMKAVGGGLLSFGSNLISDALWSATTLLPKAFSSLGFYAQDIFSALLTTVLQPILAGKYPDYFRKNKSYITTFLVNLGANVLASYAETGIKPMLPNIGASHGIILG